VADRFDKFSERARYVLQLAQEEAQRFNHNYIGTEHFLLGLVREGEGIAAKVLGNLGLELNKVRSAIELVRAQGSQTRRAEIGLTPQAKKVIEFAVDEARRFNHGYIGTEHLLLGLLREGEGVGAGVLKSLGVNLDGARAEITRILAKSPPRPGEAFHRRISIASSGASTHSALDNFLTDLTQEVRRGPVEEAADPDPLVRRIVEVLVKRHRNNPVVLIRSERDRDVTALALAVRMVRGEVPNDLARKRLVAVEFERLAAAASNMRVLNESADRVIGSLLEAGDAVLVVDKRTALRGAEHGPVHAVAGLKPALAERRLQCLIFARAGEYRAALAADPALDGYLEPIDPQAPGATPIIREPPSEPRLPPLAELSVDLTAEVQPGEIELAEEENRLLGEVLGVLTGEQARHPVLLGGNRAAIRLAHALALRLAADLVPESLRRRRLLARDVPSLALGVASRVEIGARLTHAVEEAAAAGPCIVYVDDIHALAMPEMIDALRAALGREDVRFVGATTPDLYHRHLAIEATLADRLWPVMLEGDGRGYEG
jgi:ATP-dependent Clp protease ATP-binding subunit ClpA